MKREVEGDYIMLGYSDVNQWDVASVRDRKQGCKSAR